MDLKLEQITKIRELVSDFLRPYINRLTLPLIRVYERRISDREMLKILRARRILSPSQLEAILKDASRDELTGVYNRQHLRRESDKIFSREKSGPELAFIIVDIDDFKKFNSNFDYIVGDRVLSAVGAKLREVCRNSDTIVRYGGDEFCILLPSTNVIGAKFVADKIRKSIEDCKIGYNSEELGITVSLGLCSMKIGDNVQFPMDELQSLIKKTSVSIQEAKRNGKNQVVVYDEIKERTK